LREREREREKEREMIHMRNRSRGKSESFLSDDMREWGKGFRAAEKRELAEKVIACGISTHTYIHT
jgi:hypothetical protein